MRSRLISRIVSLTRYGSISGYRMQSDLIQMLLKLCCKLITLLFGDAAFREDVPWLVTGRNRRSPIGWRRVGLTITPADMQILLNGQWARFVGEAKGRAAEEREERGCAIRARGGGALAGRLKGGCARASEPQSGLESARGHGLGGAMWMSGC